jgi:hypothetical protein
MKKYFILAVACNALFFCSCSKQDLNGTIVNSTSSSDASSKSVAFLNLKPSTNVNYGALIGAPDAKGSTSFQLNVADQIGISCLRARTYVPSTATNPLLNTSYKVLLNLNGDYKGTPLPYVTDLVKYQADLQTIIAGFTTKPIVAVIENEESNQLYYTGSVLDYINQLNVAISIMHTNGIKVANGGFTGQGLNLLVYNDFMAQGKYDSAQQFQKLTNLKPKALVTQNRAAIADTLLKAYVNMSLDYVNFHWKGTTSNTEALADVINYLRKRTNKPVITNELGQFDTDPNTLLAHVQTCTDKGMPYVLWYSPDENDLKKATPLQYTNASLTPTGNSYKEYLRN